MVSYQHFNRFIPCLFLSSYEPVRVLKANTVSENRGVGIRNVLVIIQFAASIFLIIGTIVITREMKLLQDGDLGFDKTNVLVGQTPPSFSDQEHIIRDDLRFWPIFINDVLLNNDILRVFHMNAISL